MAVTLSEHQNRPVVPRDEKASTTATVHKAHPDTEVATTHGDTDYKLGRDSQESIRLTAQHYCLVARQGFLLHPVVADAVSRIPNPRIVDVATGNGVWAAEVARRYPDTSVLGLDISDAQYSPRYTWTENLEFDLYDLLQEIPSHLLGQFDVVHVRLILSAGPNVDKTLFINRFHKLLRPGGWLQWDDLTYPNIHLVRQSGQGIAVSTSQDYPMLRILDNYLDQEARLSWFIDFEAVLEHFGGFDTIRLCTAPLRPELLTVETSLCVAVYESLMVMLLGSRRISDGEAARLRKAVSDLRKDVESGLLFSYNWHTGIAQRSE